MVLIAALVFSVALFAVLNMSLSHQQASSYNYSRYRSRYAAEAGMVWAMQKLWANPTWGSAAGWTSGSDPLIDTDGDGTPETQVDIIIPPCTQPCPSRTLQAKVVY